MRLIAALFAVALAAAAQAEEPVFGPDELVAKAKAEGHLFLYTANFTETEQLWIAGFNKRFPSIKVELTRAPGGQLITRIRTEYAAGKLAADVIDYSDRGHLLKMLDMYQAYRPPNADAFPAAAVTDPEKLWPRTTTGWCIAYNPELVSDPPKSFADLADPKWKGGKVSHVVAGAGGPAWGRALFERQVLGVDYWVKLAANGPLLFPSGAPAADAIIRGEALVGALQTNIVIPRRKEGAPIACVSPPEGTPLITYGAGIPKTAANVNAARLFLNWSLSYEGQAVFARESGGFSAMTGGPAPDGIDPAAVKPWYPKMEDYIGLQEAYLAEWNKIYNYRQ